QAGHTVREIIADIRPRTEPAERTHERPELPTIAAIIEAGTAERSAFTRADVVEKTAELIPVGAVATEKMRAPAAEVPGQVARACPPRGRRLWSAPRGRRAAGPRPCASLRTRRAGSGARPASSAHADPPRVWWRCSTAGPVGPAKAPARAAAQPAAASVSARR